MYNPRKAWCRSWVIPQYSHSYTIPGISSLAGGSRFSGVVTVKLVGRGAHKFPAITIKSTNRRDVNQLPEP